MNFDSIINPPEIDLTDPFYSKEEVQSYAETNPVLIDLENQFLECIRKRIDEKNVSKQSEIDTKDYLRISSLTGGCLRKEYYIKRKEPNNPDKLDITSLIKMDMGTETHEVIQDYFRDVLHGVEERYLDHELKLTGGNDGVVTALNGIFELKTVGFDTFHFHSKRKEPKKDHKRQVNLYMYMRNNKYKDDPNYIPLKKGYIIYWNRNLESSFGHPTREVYWQEVFQLADLWQEQGLSSIMKIFEVDYDEELIESEIKIINRFWNYVEKGKEPAKAPASKPYLCKGCRFAVKCERV